MSLQSIGHLQKAIYEMLKTDQTLNKMISGIYISVQQDAKYPFILISLSSMQDMSKYSRKIYEIEFEIAIFTRDKVQEPVLKIADHIAKLLSENSIGIAGSYVISMRKTSLEWVKGYELTSAKVVMKYKGIIGNLNAIS